MCLLAICISSSEKCLFRSFASILNCLFFCCWDWRVLLYWRSWRVLLYVFWILSSYQIYDLQTFSPILCFAFFHSVDNYLLMHKVFLFSQSPVYLFCLLFPLPVVPYPRNHCQVQYHEDFSLYFLPRVLRFVNEWMKSLSRVQLFATPWTVAYQALLSMGFFRQEYWSGLPFSSYF